MEKIEIAFKIPQKYKVGGQEMNVEFIENMSNLGECSVCEGYVRIANNSNGQKQSESSKLNTFMHELTHSILDTMGNYELSKDEIFVSSFAALLTEAITTMEE